MPNGDYDSAAASLAGALEVESPGVGFVLAPTGQSEEVAAALVRALPGAGRVESVAKAVFAGPRLSIVAGLPQDRREAISFLSDINGRRNWIAAHGRHLLFVLTRQELGDFQSHAADSFSTKLYVETMALAPDESVTLETARDALARWQAHRFGRLDLRGFVRHEGEDASWRVEEIYQELNATVVSYVDGKMVTTQSETEARVVEWLDAVFAHRNDTVVILGHPGSGKTFFLRWLAIHAGIAETALRVPKPLPILISLSTYVQAVGPITLLEHVSETMLAAGQPAAFVLAQAIEQGSAVFLLDGLDEVGDELARQRTVDAVDSLRRAAPLCRIVLTSRIAGYSSASLSAFHLVLAPFDNSSIRNFLTKWCELYAVSRAGDTTAVRADGRSEGHDLARDVLDHKEVRELARNPLLLTVLAIVHRAGVRLPDHRVELYEHATRVLVERWNRVRSLSSAKQAIPLKAADAVRLLGPIALETIRSGVRGVIAETELRGMLDRSLSAGSLKGIATTDEALSLFRNSLGLLVEQGPGLYSFLHLTLAEYFAAWELVRSDALESLVSDPRNAYFSEWREVVLLAAGELGVIRADDARLDSVVSTLIESAGSRAGQPSAAVPSLLAGLLADDPGLSPQAAHDIIDTLLPTWWFKRVYGRRESFPLVVQEAVRLVDDRIRNGRFGEMLRERVATYYESGIAPDVRENLLRGGQQVMIGFLRFLEVVGVDYGYVMLQFLDRYSSPDLLLRSFGLRVLAPRVADGFMSGHVSISRVMFDKLRLAANGFSVKGRIWLGPHMLRRNLIWSLYSRALPSEGPFVTLLVRAPVPEAAEADGPTRAMAYLSKGARD